MKNSKISKIENRIQDHGSEAWIKLCEYVDKVAETGGTEFSPRNELGPELYSQIHTLPESIAKLTKVRKMWLYGSKLKRIPPEIGEMKSLEYFDPYTSSDLHWFPYEITQCKKLKDSTVSTRVLYGNTKNRMGFPYLGNSPVRYTGSEVTCSVCKKNVTYEETDQLWISLRVGTDVLPLLVNSCSEQCTSNLPEPPTYYVSGPHKGGSQLKQPNLEEENVWSVRSEQKPRKTSKLFGFIRKIWEK